MSPIRTANPREVRELVMSVSAVLLFGFLVFVLCHWAGLRALHAVVCVMFGFYLASSPLAASVSSAMGSLAQLVSGH